MCWAISDRDFGSGNDSCQGHVVNHIFRDPHSKLWTIFLSLHSGWFLCCFCVSPSKMWSNWTQETTCSNTHTHATNNELFYYSYRNSQEEGPIIWPRNYRQQRSRDGFTAAHKAAVKLGHGKKWCMATELLLRLQHRTKSWNSHLNCIFGWSYSAPTEKGGGASSSQRWQKKVVRWFSIS